MRKNCLPTFDSDKASLQIRIRIFRKPTKRYRLAQSDFVK